MNVVGSRTTTTQHTDGFPYRTRGDPHLEQQPPEGPSQQVHGATNVVDREHEQRRGERDQRLTSSFSLGRASFVRPGSLSLFFAVVVIAPLGVGFWLAWQRYRKLRQMQALETAVLPTDVCLACGAKNVEVVEPLVVRCRECGFVGGQGMADLQARLRHEEDSLLSDDDRRARARKQLHEARIWLASAEELLKDALRSSWFDIAGLSFDRGRTKQETWACALQHIGTAEELSKHAAELLGETSGGQIDAPTQSALLASLDTGLLSDGLVVDVGAHFQLKKALAAVRQMSERVQSQLERCG